MRPPAAQRARRRARRQCRLAETIAARTSASADEMWVGIAAHAAMMVAEMSLDLNRSSEHPVPSATVARAIMRLLAADCVVLPRLPAGGSETAHSTKTLA